MEGLVAIAPRDVREGKAVDSFIRMRFVLFETVVISGNVPGCGLGAVDRRRNHFCRMVGIWRCAGGNSNRWC